MHDRDGKVGGRRSSEPFVAQPSLHERLFNRLREDLPERRAALSAAFTEQPPDTAAIRAECHRLAGAAAYCGQMELLALTEALGRTARLAERRVQEPPPPELAEAWNALEEWLEHWSALPEPNTAS